VGADVGRVQLRPNVSLVAPGAIARQALRGDVDLEVEPSELLDEGGIVDPGQDRLVQHRRAPIGIDEVELDLHAGQRLVEVEERCSKHPREDVEAPVHLVPVPLPVLAGEGTTGQTRSHATRVPETRRHVCRVATVPPIRDHASYSYR
jgi:hypothetical protein